MKRALFVTNYYMNSNSANGICLEQIVNCMPQYDTICDVLAFGDSKKAVAVNDRITVYFVRAKFSGRKGIINRAMRYLSYLIVSRIVSPDTNIINHRRMRKKAEQLIRANHYDAIIPSSGGFAIQEIGLWIKKRYGIALIPMFYDPPASENFMYQKHWIYYQRFLHLQEDMLKQSDAILVESNINDNTQTFQAVSYCKRIYMPFMQSHSPSSAVCDRNKVIYIGSLYKDIRNPKYAIELLAQFPEISVDFYGGKQTEMVLEGYPSPNAQYRGSISHEMIEKLIHESGYLLSIGNTVATQIPGKLMEYISYGRPIINIVKSAEDKTIALIKQYGNGLSLVEGELENAEKLRLFLAKPYEVVSSEKLRAVFPQYTPEYNANCLSSCIKVHSRGPL